MRLAVGKDRFTTRTPIRTQPSESLSLRIQPLELGHLRLRLLVTTEVCLQDGVLGFACSPAYPTLTIIAPFPTLQAALPVFSLASTSLDALVRSSVLASPHAMSL